MRATCMTECALDIFTGKEVERGSSALHACILRVIFMSHMWCEYSFIDFSMFDSRVHFRLTTKNNSRQAITLAIMPLNCTTPRTAKISIVFCRVAEQLIGKYLGIENVSR
jgi:uncharacterized membrane protein YesL